MTRKYGGTGLGLPITKNIIELMGGRLKIESVPGRGSEFSFSLDFEISDMPDDSYKTAKSPAAQRQRPIFKGDVLVCEDNPLNQEVIGEHLRRIGLTVTIAGNGKAGVDAVKERLETGKPFDIILMDIHMPEMSGLEAAQKLDALGNRTPIVAMTANVISGNEEAYKEHGMRAYLGKPFVAQDLWACLLKFLVPLKMESLAAEDRAGINIASANFPAGEETRGADFINGALGLKLAGGDQKLYQKLKRNFYRNNQNAFAELTETISAGDITKAHRMVHTLKAVAGLIGAQKLQKAAYEIEKALAGGKKNYTAGQMRTYETALKDVLDFLAPPEAENETSETLRPGGCLPDREKQIALLDTLEPLLKTGDFTSTEFTDAVKETFPSCGGQSAALAEQIADYEFEKACETLIAIRKIVEGD
jgi:CheY-like chemotaxis protein